jgi:hypothetical protein
MESAMLVDLDPYPVSRLGMAQFILRQQQKNGGRMFKEIILGLCDYTILEKDTASFIAHKKGGLIILDTRIVGSLEVPRAKAELSI